MTDRMHDQPWDADTFSDERVTAMAARHQLILAHHAQWEFLRATTSVDLQAGPGSGKTSLVALKLSVLAESWNARGQGICVLSHTNTAKDEILARLGITSKGRSLSGYPHFVGTIQGFANTFFALPRLRSRAIDVHAVDDAAYAEAALRMARGRRYQTLRSAMSHQTDGERLIAEATYVFNGSKLVVDTSQLKPAPDTPSAQQFRDLKHALAKQGIFRYADMFAIAQDYLAGHPEMVKAAQRRFPFVLIDEMQDTSLQQDDLLSAVYGSSAVVVQRVGDQNQRIFEGRASAAAPASPTVKTIDLAVSRRFGPEIARVASALTVQRRQAIEGVGRPGRLVLIVFDETSIHRVVPAFEKLAAATVPHDTLVASPPQVLGTRKSRGSTDKFPQGIGCYSPEYAASTDADGAGLIHAARRAQQIIEAENDMRNAAELLWNAFRDLYRHCVQTQPDTKPTTLPPLNRLDRATGSPGHRIRRALATILDADLSDENAWEITATQLIDSVSQQTEWALPHGIDTHERLAFSPAEASALSTEDELGAETETSTQTVRAQLGTIHGAKGETHSATLILECLDRKGLKHNVPEALAVICGDATPQVAGKLVKEALQLVFVGATRPTHLLAMAVHEARATPYLDRLQAAGWEIHLLTSSSTPANTSDGSATAGQTWVPVQRGVAAGVYQATLWT